MSNLSIENLSKVMQVGEPGGAIGGGASGFGGVGGAPGIANNAAVEREMSAQGMSAPSAGGQNFSDILRKSVDQVNTDQFQADTAIKEMVAGRNKNIHETMLTVEKADMSLKLMMQVRNKILDAYREIMRMQV